MWDMIVSVPDHCLSFYLVMKVTKSLCSLNLKQLCGTNGQYSQKNLNQHSTLGTWQT